MISLDVLTKNDKIAYQRTIDSWKNAKDFGKILSVDFDGVICKFDGWKGPNIFGDPIEGAALTLRKLYETGWYICIFTTRLVTIELVNYLNEHSIPFDDINGRVRVLNRGYLCEVQFYTNEDDNFSYETIHKNGARIPVPFYWRHNPEFASIKPIASVYLDDMNWENEGKNYTKETWERVYLSLSQRFPKEK